MIQESEDILRQIREKEHLSAVFNRWEPSFQQEFLDICTGARGVKILYDSFFKETLNPETAPEYLEDFLSLLLKQQVKILCVLPNDSTRIANESSLLICFFASIKEYEANERKNSITKISRPSIPSSCLNAVLRNFKNIPYTTCIDLNNAPIPTSGWNCFRNICSFRLTSFSKTIKIKM